jgi:hypothetical protein
MNVKLSDLTLVGWLLTLLTVTVIVVLMIYSGRIWHAVLPGGTYPAVLLAAPGLLLGVLFFAAGAGALEALGLPVVRIPDEDREEG